jgi:DNA ligase 1
MKQFAELFRNLDQTNATNEKVGLLADYFKSGNDPDRIWALALFMGRRPPRKVKTRQLQNWAIELSGIPLWLFEECYASVGDLGETISLLIPGGVNQDKNTLAWWFEQINNLKPGEEDSLQEFVFRSWKMLSQREIFIFNKLLMGSLRIGVGPLMVARAIAEAFDIPQATVTHRLMGAWDPGKLGFEELLLKENSRDHASRPYPFFLASSLDDQVRKSAPDQFMVEWKYDGIRAQVIHRERQLFIWSRGEELISAKFPELMALQASIPEGTVIDGEIVCANEQGILPFHILQTRIGRKQIGKKILLEAPAKLIAYDIPESSGEDIRHWPQDKRRSALEELHALAGNDLFRLSPLLEFSSWEDLQALHLRSRAFMAEGFMLKNKQAAYLSGRRKGGWWKWKTEPMSADAVLIYAQKGHGRRADLFTDYTFAVWDQGRLVTFAKAYSGLNDAEIREVDRFVRQHTLEKFGPVRTVEPKLVFEIGFEGINPSPRHKSGIAVRFPRILRWRKDKPAEEADTLENLKQLLQ